MKNHSSTIIILCLIYIAKDTHAKTWLDDIDNACRKGDLRSCEIYKEYKKDEEDMLNMPDNKRDRQAFLNENDTLVEKKSDLYARLIESDWTTPEWRKQTGEERMVTELQFREHNAIYGFAIMGAGKKPNQGSNSIKILYSAPQYIYLQGSFRNSTPSPYDRYAFYVYDRKHKNLYRTIEFLGKKPEKTPTLKLESGVYKFRWQEKRGAGTIVNLYYDFNIDKGYIECKRSWDNSCDQMSEFKQEDKHVLINKPF